MREKMMSIVKTLRDKFSLKEIAEKLKMKNETSVRKI